MSKKKTFQNIDADLSWLFFFKNANLFWKQSISTYDCVFVSRNMSCDPDLPPQGLLFEHRQFSINRDSRLPVPLPWSRMKLNTSAHTCRGKHCGKLPPNLWKKTKRYQVIFSLHFVTIFTLQKTNLNYWVRFYLSSAISFNQSLTRPYSFKCMH